MFGRVGNENYWHPTFQASIPVSLYVNGKVVPPIEAEGEIHRVSPTGLKLRCKHCIPIPARGIMRFSLPESEHLEAKVEFLSRVETGAGGWFRKSELAYEFEVNLIDISKEGKDQLRKYFHELLYNGAIPKKAVMAPQG
jgi:hypothetical protein